MTLLRGYGENLPLNQWLHDRIFPFEAQLSPEDILYQRLYAGVCREMLRFGVTSTSEMYYMGEASGQAVLDSRIRGNISLSVTCFDDSHLADLPIYQETDRLLSP